jgi:hypothetical protein
VLAFALMVNARPQEYDDYDQAPTRAPARHQQNNHKQHQQRNEDRETTTFVPIIQYDKEQDISGNYKTQ